jgi:hypothetical protein
MYGEVRTSAWLALHIDPATVGFDNPVADGQTQTQTASFLRGKKRLEDLRQCVGIDTVASVRNSYDQLICRVCRGAYSQPPAPRHRVHGVQAQIEQHLLELLSVGMDLR